MDKKFEEFKRQLVLQHTQDEVRSQPGSIVKDPLGLFVFFFWCPVILNFMSQSQSILHPVVSSNSVAKHSVSSVSSKFVL